MFLLRKIGSLLRGKATPLQIYLAAILGGMLGFVPGFFLRGDLGGGFAQAPALILGLLCLVLVLNANLALFGLVTLLAKLLSYLVLPLTYRLGVLLVDGMPELFRSLANGKVTAWCGFEYYATTGGLVFGLGAGIATGFLANRLLRAVRAGMAKAEANSAAYQRFAGRWWVKLLSWVFLGGGKGKLSWQELAERGGKGLPIRPLGIVLAAVLVGSLWILQQYFSTPILTQTVKSGLEWTNGAQVDLAAAGIDFGSGELRIQKLAITDSQRPHKDLLAADALVGTLDMGELLRRRCVVEVLRAQNARAGTGRSTPGVVFPKPAPEKEPENPAGVPTLDDYLKDYEVWKQRLEQIREWWNKIAGGEAAPATPEEAEQRRQAQEQALGLAKVRAEQLLDQAPAFEIRRIEILGIDYTMDDVRQKYDLVASSLSSAPTLLTTPPKFGLRAQDDGFALELFGKSKTESALGFALALRKLDVDRAFGGVKLKGQAPLRGGTLQIETGGKLTSNQGQALGIDLPVRLQLANTTFALPGAKETPVEQLLLPVGLRGPVTRPSVLLDDTVLKDALLAAGKQELANFVQGQAGKLLGKLPAGLQGVVDLQKPPEQIVGDVKAKAEAEAKAQLDAAKAKAEAEAKAAHDQLAAEAKAAQDKLAAEAAAAKKKAEEEAKKAEEAARKKLEEEAKKRLPGGLPLPGLPGGRNN